MARYQKFLVALATAISVAVAQGTIPSEWTDEASVALAFLGALGIYAVPNRTKNASNQSGGSWDENDPRSVPDA